MSRLHSEICEHRLDDRLVGAIAGPFGLRSRPNAESPLILVSDRSREELF